MEFSTRERVSSKKKYTPIPLAGLCYLLMRALHHSRRRRRWQVCPCDLRRAILDQPRTRMEAAGGGEGCPRARERVGGWVLARRECVGAVRRSGDCLHPLSLSHSCPSSLTPSCSICPFPSLSSSLSTPSPILVLSLIFSPSLVLSLAQRDYSREHPGGQSVRRQPPRRRDAPLSLSSLPRLSLGSVCSIATLRRAPPTVPHREERRRR